MLYVVATPIGNLADLSPRARETLDRVAFVAAEDTRHTGQLLTQLGLHKRLVSLHEHNEAERVGEVLAALGAGQDVALVSDAGTPLVSDPGFRLLAAVRAAGLPASPVPGPSAALAALSVAGLPSDRFYFEGFLPPRPAGRRRRLVELAARAETLIFFEAVHRIDASLADLADAFGPDRPAMLARELTKRHETLYRGSLAEVRQARAADPGGHRGEFTLVVGGCEAAPAVRDEEIRRVLGVLAAELPPGQAARLTARLTGARRQLVYRLGGLPESET